MNCQIHLKLKGFNYLSPREIMFRFQILTTVLYNCHYSFIMSHIPLESVALYLNIIINTVISVSKYITLWLATFKPGTVISRFILANWKFRSQQSTTLYFNSHKNETLHESVVSNKLNRSLQINVLIEIFLGFTSY